MDILQCQMFHIIIFEFKDLRKQIQTFRMFSMFHNCFIRLGLFQNVPYLFFLNGHEIQTSIAECAKHQLLNTEKTLPIIYQPQAVFKVRPVSRCTSSMPGHTKEVLVASFSTSGRFLGKYSELTILEKSQIANSST